MDILEQAFSGQSTDRVEKIIAAMERIQKIESAISTVKYDNTLLEQIPETVKILGAAKEAVIAELKTL